MNIVSGKPSLRTSVVTQLSLLFLSLAVVNLVVTWIFSGANQMRLIAEKASMSGATVAVEVLRRLEPLFAQNRGLQADPDIQLINRALQTSANVKTLLVREYFLFTSEFDIAGAYPVHKKTTVSAEMTQNILRAVQLRDLNGQTYLAKPSVTDYHVDLYIPLTNTGARDLVFYTRVHVDSVANDLNSLVRLVAATIVLMLVIQAAIGFLIYRILIKPIRDVSAAAITLGGGDFATVDLPRRQRDEILLLVESFNKMSGDLREKDRIIKSQIEELKEKNDTLDFELDIAERIQLSILPDTQKLESYGVTLHYKPLYKVSGDFFDIAVRPNGTLAVLIADASGHGVPAAFLTILMKVFFSEFIGQASTPGELMQTINRSICRYLEGTGFYLTAFVVFIGPEGRSSYCNCGHPPPLVVGGLSKPLELAGLSDVIGIIPDSENYSSHDVHLKVGQKLILFTDGLTELRNTEGEFLPADSLNELTVEYGDAEHSSLNGTILEFARRFQGDARLSDDLTLAVVNVSDAQIDLPAPADGFAETAVVNSLEVSVIDLLRQLISVRDTSTYQVLLANSYLRSGQINLARSTVAKALEKFPASASLARIAEKIRLNS